MTDKEIEENNKLIMNFIGNTGTKDWDGTSIFSSPNGDIRWTKEVRENSFKVIERSKYNYSWDWLMSVVERIEQLGYSTIIRYFEDEFSNFVEIENGDEHPLQICCFTAHIDEDSKLNLLYKAVIEFIKYYNEHN